MDFNDIDFEGTGTANASTTTNTTNGGLVSPPIEETTAIDGQQDVVDINKQNTVNNVNANPTNEEKPSNSNTDSSTGGLAVGDQVEFDGVTYKVDANGNLVDNKGVIFKEAKDIAEWLKSTDVVDDNTENTLDIAAIQDAIGISVTDENGKNIEFTNDAEGVKSYINSVIELKANDIQQATINKFFNDNPYVKQFVDYVQLTGSPRGFGDIPDRSGIEIDKDNVAQQEAIIKMAATEFGNKTLNDNYIKYLKDTGTLYDEANVQLQALVEKDNNYKKEIETKAEQARMQEQKEIQEYWTKVNNVIASGTIAGYKLPSSFIKESNGQKITVTPNDFYNYLSKQVGVDANGNAITGYQKDLSQLSDEALLDRELLDAWLIFTGGSYKDLVDMAIKEEQVKRLKVKSKEQRTTKTVKITKANQDKKVDWNDILL